MQVRPDDIVRVKNKEAYAIRIKWNSREYVLAPDRDTFIPGACAFLWFGDPRASSGFQSVLDEDGMRQFIVDRPTEIRRLRIKWGAGIDGDESNFDGVAIPSIEVWTAEGERVVTVLDDPDGRNTMPASVTAQEDEDLRALVKSQARQLEMMKQHLGLNEEADKAAANESDLPRDGETLVYADESR